MNLKRHDTSSDDLDRADFERELDASLLDDAESQTAKEVHAKKATLRPIPADASASGFKDSFMLDSFNPRTRKIKIQNLQTSQLSESGMATSPKGSGVVVTPPGFNIRVGQLDDSEAKFQSCEALVDKTTSEAPESREKRTPK